MPLRPFPYALKVGTDICNVSRVRQLLAKQKHHQPFLYRFLKRVLTDPERTYFWHRFGPRHEVFGKIDAVSQYIAGRFAAKEAIRKACDVLGDSTRGFHYIMILPIAPPSDRSAHQSAPPRGLILDAEYKTRHSTDQDNGFIENGIDNKHLDVNTLSGQLCEISISHDGDFATAVALVPTQAQSTQVGEGASVMPVSQRELKVWEGNLKQALSMDQSSEYIDAEQTLKKDIKALMADLRRRNTMLDRISELRNKERLIARREKQVFDTTTKEERLRWRMVYSKESSLSASLPSNEDVPKDTEE